MKIVRRAIQQLKHLNLFNDDNTAATPEAEETRDQIRATRIYVVLLNVSLSVLVILSSLAPRNESVTIKKTSLATYEQLQMVYPDTLSCPCQNIAISHDSFISIIPTYRQVCSSDLISYEWIVSLFNPEVARITPLNSRVSAAGQFRILALTCLVSVASIENLNTIYKQEQFVSTRVLSSTSLCSQANAIIGKFDALMATKVTPSSGMQLLEFILSTNGEHSALHTNLILTSMPGSQSFEIVDNFYPKYDNATYSSVSSFSDNERVGIHATRAYVLLLTACVVILTFYFWITVHTLTIVIAFPSRATFERLHDSYSLTFTCPCSQVAIPKDQIINASSLRLHAICSSLFVTPTWFVGYFQIKFPNATEQRTLPVVDFRYAGYTKFLAYEVACQRSAATMANAQVVFFNDPFISAFALSPAEFKAGTDSAIASFQTQTANNIGLLSSPIQLSIVASGIESDFAYQSVFVNNSWLVTLYSPAPAASNVCACSVASECELGSLDVLCVFGNNCTVGSNVWAV
ncbi:unnamed protein product [Rotaria magnacalcarata]|uniref:Uncharacterized protein n=1 Tax=Rotaria magnacalcarata TaxID=392030 RepID=A0A815I0N7_9BILA|nr:unnamed protein product [Rotaria magnacalcarata]